MTLEELQILITSETSGLRKELSNVKKELNNVNRDVKSVANSIKTAFKGVASTLAAIGIGASIRSATREAMAFEAAVQQIRRLMGSNAGEFQQWANENAAALGMARAEAVRYGAVFANLVSNFTTSMAQTAQYTQDLLQASAVVASYTGRTMEDVLDRIRSGLLGNTEAIEDLGINVNVAMIEATQAFQRFANGRSWEQLDFRTQQTIRYFAILEQAAQKYGIEIAQNTASRQAAFIAQLKDAQLALGQAFLPIYNTVLPALTSMAAALANVMRYVAAFSQALFGYNPTQQAQQAQATQAQADAVAAVGDAYQEAGKKAKGALAGFDEINQLAESSAGAGSGGGGAAQPDLGSMLDPGEIDTSAIPSKAQEMADRVREIFRNLQSEMAAYGQQIAAAFSGVVPALQPIIDAKEPIVAAFQDIGRTAGELVGTFLRPLADYLLLDFVPSIVTAFAQSFAPVFADVLVWSWQEFATVFQNTTAMMSNLLNTVWLPAADNIKNAFIAAFPVIADAVQSVLDGTIKPFVHYVLNDFILPIAEQINRTFVPIFADVGVWAIQQFAETFRWAANLINDIYNSVIRPVFDLIKTIVLDTLQVVTNLWQKHGQTLLSNLSELFANIRGTFQKLWDEILKPIIRPFLEMLSWLWEKHLKGLVEQVGEFVMKLINAALEIFNKFIMPIVNWLIDKLGPTFSRIFNFVVDVVGTAIGTIADILKGLFQILGGVIDFIVGVFTGNWQKAWEGIKDIFAGIWEIMKGVLKGALNIIIDMINAFIRFWNKIELKVPEIDIPLVGKVGGFSVGVPKIPEIPKLARGGIVDSPTLAMIGEAGKEAIVPLENTSFVEAIRDAVASGVGNVMLSIMQFAGGNQDGRSGDIVFQIDGTTFARIINPYLIRENQRIGNIVIVQPV